MYRPAGREPLEGPGRGREASVTPPRTPNDSNGWARCQGSQHPSQKPRLAYPSAAREWLQTVCLVADG
jgi:hypothetical protein